MTPAEVLGMVRQDVEAVEAAHAFGEDGACPTCGCVAPCPALACGTWLRRLVLERTTL